jgi:excisionase family DNA binding protein
MSDNLTPLGVPPIVGMRLLGYSRATFFALLKAGELESYGSGRARRILMSSINDYIKHNSTRRGPGRPRKTANT